MTDLKNKDYVVIVQCHIVKERCPGYNCEKAFHDRTGGFAGYPGAKAYRTLYLTCGGCCGRALQRKLSNLARRIKKQEGIAKSGIVVQLSSCITKDNFHAPPCPHLNYLKTLISKVGLDVCEDTFINETSEKRCQEGQYSVRN